MKLTTAQATLVKRAEKNQLVRYINNQRGMDLGDLMFCDIHGSAQHRTAQNLQDKGIGKIVSIQPLNYSFFALLKTYTVSGTDGYTVEVRTTTTKNALYQASKNYGIVNGSVVSVV